MTFAVFFVIPLMKRLEKAFGAPPLQAREELVLNDIEDEFESPPEEEPPPEEEEPEPPEMDEQPPDLDLALEIPDLASGIGGIIIDLAPKFDVKESPDDFFDSGDLDQPPRATAKFPPRYPPSLISRRVMGRVVVRAMVDERGSLSQVTGKESSGHNEKDRAATNAIKRWRFRPAIREGRKVKAPVVQPFSFKVS